MAWDAYTKLMLHMNGDDASTTFTDEIGHTFTALGNAQIDTAQSKFGGASGLFDGTGDAIDTPDHADFTVGAGEFTVDVWIKRNAINTRQVICGNVDNAGANATLSILLELRANNTVRGGLVSSETEYFAASTGTITDTASFHHIALVRDNTGTDTIRIFIDGAADGTVACDGITANDSAYKFAIGRLGEYNGIYWNGWLDEFRFSNGVARWTSNFTPPTAEYTAGWANITKINGVASTSISKVNSIPVASISKVNGIAV